LHLEAAVWCGPCAAAPSATALDTPDIADRAEPRVSTCLILSFAEGRVERLIHRWIERTVPAARQAAQS